MSMPITQHSQLLTLTGFFENNQLLHALFFSKLTSWFSLISSQASWGQGTKTIFASHQAQVGSHQVAWYIMTTSIKNWNHLPTALTLEAFDLAASVVTLPDVPRKCAELWIQLSRQPCSDFLGEGCFGYCHSDSISPVPSPTLSHLHLSFLAFWVISPGCQV